jgi:hypothetical protein
LLQKESGGKEPSSLLNTHPVIADRIEHIREKMPSLRPVLRNNEGLKKTFHEIFENW